MNILLRPTNACRLGFACGTILAASLGASQLRAEEVTKSFSVSGRPNVRVETNDGSVRVSSRDAKQVEFKVNTKDTIWAGTCESMPGKMVIGLNLSRG
ncbi:MAG TPA: hypothetical protein VNB49_01680 [Candidatus Dormibacteraeota bacterium]|nr:hypothetical protein [Candidatus Dormibacteraeota bacterium]